MTRQRRTGVLFGLLAFLVLGAAALLSPYPDRFFSGLPGIEEDLSDRTSARLSALGVDGAIVTADGQDLSVELPNGLPVGLTAASLKDVLRSEDGVRTLTFDIGAPAAAQSTPVPEPTATAVPAPEPTATAVPAPEPTATAVPAPEPTATAVPAPEPTATAVPAPEPTATAVPAPEPTATAVPAPEPTATAVPAPEPTATAVPSASEIVGGLDLGAVRFEDGTAVLTAQARSALDAVAQSLSSLEGVTIEVQGHTESTGDPDANLLLSQLRAEAVVEYLVSQGIDRSLLTPKGFGGSRPIADNGTDQGQTANRRIELVVAEGN